MLAKLKCTVLSLKSSTHHCLVGQVGQVGEVGLLDIRCPTIDLLDIHYLTNGLLDVGYALYYPLTYTVE